MPVVDGYENLMTREQALRALTEDGITACRYCRPDRELGVL